MRLKHRRNNWRSVRVTVQSSIAGARCESGRVHSLIAGSSLTIGRCLLGLLFAVALMGLDSFATERTEQISERFTNFDTQPSYQKHVLPRHLWLSR